MKTQTFIRTLLGSVLLTAAATVFPVKAEITNCTAITSTGATINSPGIYCLTGNIDTPGGFNNGNAIHITANNVTLDLNGWKLDGQAAGTATQATGIMVEADYVTIQNGTIRGFRNGILFYGRGGVVQNIRAEQITSLGILVSGAGIVVRRNQLLDIGGSTVSATMTAYGIIVLGNNNLVENNFIAGLTAGGSSHEYGILAANAHWSMVRGNFVTDSAKPTGGGISYGIVALASSWLTIRENNVTNYNSGIIYGLGSGGKYMNNLTSYVGTAFSGGTSVGTND